MDLNIIEINNRNSKSPLFPSYNQGFDDETGKIAFP